MNLRPKVIVCLLMALLFLVQQGIAVQTPNVNLRNDGSKPLLSWTDISDPSLFIAPQWSCCFGDLDLDSQFDCLGAGGGDPSGAGGVNIWKYNGGTSWSSSSAGLPTTCEHSGIWFGKINNNNYADLVVCRYNWTLIDDDEGIYAYAGGASTWTLASSGLPTTGNFYRVRFGDINNDGLDDIIAGTPSGISAWLGNGAGSWTPASTNLPTAGNYYAVDVGYINSDLYVDIAAASDNGVEAWVGDGSGSWSPASTNLPPSGTWGAVCLGNINGDSYLDIAASGFDSGGSGIVVWTGNGLGIWTPASTGLPSSGGYWGLRFGDVDFDGSTDIAASTEYYSNGGIEIWKGDGSGSWTSTTSPASSLAQLMDVCLGDINGDGSLDLGAMTQQRAWVWKNDLTAGDTTPPAQTTDLSAINPTTSSLTLTWTAPADNGTDFTSGSATMYDARYTTTGIIDSDPKFISATQCTGEPTPGVPGSTESFVVNGLNSGTTYWFALKTRDEVPNWSPLSNSPSGTTTGSVSDTTPPAQTTDLAATTPTTSSITLTWTAPADNGTDPSSGNAFAYDVRYSTSDIINDAEFNAATQAIGEPTPSGPGSTESFIVAGLSSGTKYYFALKTRDEVPNWSLLSNSANNTTTGTPTDTTPPAGVTDLAAGSPTANSITLTWTASADNGTDPSSGNAALYDIRYLSGTTQITDANWASATQCTGEPTPAAPGTSETFIVPGLTANTQYYFALKTADEVPNWSIISNSPTATTSSQPGVDDTPPAAVTDLATGSPTQTSITLIWTAPADNGTDPSSGNAAQYDIRYLAGSTPITNANWASATQCTGEPAPQVPGTSETFLVAGLTPGTQYYFALKTADEVPNWSGLSNSPTETTQQGSGPQLVMTAPNTVDENTDFNVTVTAIGSPVSGVKVTFDSLDKTTDADGNVTFTSPSVTLDTQYTLTANKTGYTDGTKTITVKDVGQQPALSVTVAASPTAVDSGGGVSITVRVTSGSSNITGASITLSDEGGGGSFTSVTDKGNGEYSATYTAPTTSVLKTVTIKATVTKSGFNPGTGQKDITVRAESDGGDGGGGGGTSSDNTLLYVGMIVAVIMVVLLILAALLMRKKKREAQQMQPAGYPSQPYQQYAQPPVQQPYGSPSQQYPVQQQYYPPPPKQNPQQQEQY